MNDDSLKIRPLFSHDSDLKEEFELHAKALEQSLRKLIPASIISEAPDPLDKMATFHFFNRVYEQLPLVSSLFTSQEPYVICLKFLAQSKYTQGMGRFLSDMISMWLIPGKQLPLISVKSMAFEFAKYPWAGFFYHEILIQIESEKDFETSRSNLPHIIREIKLNIAAVQHARKLVAEKQLSQEQKAMLLQENLSSLLSKSNLATTHSIYDDVHHFLVKIMAEERIGQIQEQIAPLMDRKPQIFERNLFNDLNETLAILDDAFLANRKGRHITRIVAYLYLFKKTIFNLTLLHSNQRHLSLKLFRLQIGEPKRDPVFALGMILSINLIRENELLEERHLKKAIQSTLAGLYIVEGSFYEPKRLGSVRNFYIEFAKKNNTPFTSSEFLAIQQKLSLEVKTRIETVINPIFMQKNEEETLRNILVLSSELKYVHDLPQVTINFHKQSDDYLSFIVIIARIFKEDSAPLKEKFKNLPDSFIVESCDVKNVGLFRKKHPKEATVLEIKVLKSNFLREDFSLDLYEARRVVYNGVKSIMGEIRDYNGGMISKQNEALGELTKLLLEDDIQNNFLIENYFYSITPVYMQSVLPPIILKKQFMMVIGAMEHDYNEQSYFMQMQIVDNYCILLLASMYPGFKEAVSEAPESIGLDASCLTTSYLSTNDILCVGYFYPFSHPKDYEKLIIAVTESVKKWKKGLDLEGDLDPISRLTSIKSF
jgi:hypothetical protein